MSFTDTPLASRTVPGTRQMLNTVYKWLTAYFCRLRKIGTCIVLVKENNINTSLFLNLYHGINVLQIC